MCEPRYTSDEVADMLFVSRHYVFQLATRSGIEHEDARGTPRFWTVDEINRMHNRVDRRRRSTPKVLPETQVTI